MDKITAGCIISFLIILGLAVTTQAAPATYPPPSALFCHVCVDAADNDACNKTHYCDQESGCLTSVWNGDGQIVIQKRCASKEICMRMERHNKKVCYNMAGGFDGTCSFCCHTPGCNKGMHAHEIAQPMSGRTPTPRHPTQPTRPPVHSHSHHHQGSCEHHDNGVVTVEEGQGYHAIPGMKISINVEFPNGLQTPCGCNGGGHVTKQTSPPRMTTSTSPAPSSSTHPSTPTTTTTTTGTPDPSSNTTQAPSTTSAATTAITKPPSSKAASLQTTREAPTTSVLPSTSSTVQPTTATAAAATPTTPENASDTSITNTTTTTNNNTTTIPHIATSHAVTHANGPTCFTCDDPSCQTMKVETCLTPDSLCMNTITQDINGKRIFAKGCASQASCQKDWYQHTAGLVDCFLLDDSPTGPPGMALSKCSFCCQGDGCNSPAVPMKTLWYP